MKLQILDASVAIKWFVPEEEGRREALAILDEVRDAPARFAVPDLFFNEMLAVLTRLASPDSSLVREYLDALQIWGSSGSGTAGSFWIVRRISRAPSA